MSFMTTDSKQAGGLFAPVPEGTYEALVTNVEVTASKKGTPMIKATLTIRQDVDQQAQKRKLFDYWLAFPASENPLWKLQQIALACGYSDGHSFDTIDAFAQAMLFEPVRIKIKHEDSEYQGEATVRDVIAQYSKSNIPYTGSGGGNSDPFAQGDNKPIDISDDDLPF